MYHYGCTTSICQVNDTDLHAEFERVYLEFEAVSFFDQQRYDHGHSGRSRQQVGRIDGAEFRGVVWSCTQQSHINPIKPIALQQHPTTVRTHAYQTHMAYCSKIIT